MTKRILKKAVWPFKNAQGARLSKQLFHEIWITLMEESRVCLPPFSLNTDREGLINFGRKYIEYGDVTGYKISMELFRDYAYWEFLMRSPWFKEAKENWDRSIYAKQISIATDALNEIARDPEDKGRLSASKFLFDNGLKGLGLGPARRGRPSKEEVDGQVKLDALAAKEIEDDLKRIKAVS